MKQVICTHCKSSFTYYEGLSTGKYCSRECFRDHTRKYANARQVKINGYTRRIFDIVCLNCHSAHVACRSTAKYCSSRCQLNYEYAHQTRDKSTIALAAHESVRQNGQPKRRGVKRGSPPQSVCDKISATKFARHAAYRAAHGMPEPALARELRGSRKWRDWRKAIYERDKYTCVLCGDDKGGNLEADHIKPRYLFPELTFDVSNGRTLCKPCHKKTATFGARVKLLRREDFDLAA